MKCISLWQPWASLIVAGSKRIETRHWPTSYRGEILIHAAKKPWKSIERFIAEPWLLRNGLLGIVNDVTPWHEQIPYGAIVGKATLVDCRRTELILADLERAVYRAQVALADHHQKREFYFTEYCLGDFSDGRYGWFLEDAYMFKDPIPYRGQQGLFDVSPEVIKEAQLCRP